MLKNFKTRSDGWSHQRGVSIVEMLVGVAIGLFIVAGALVMLANSTAENRRLILETRLVQDLRAASDVITRDIRRAGYWQTATSGIWVNGGPTVPAQNAYNSFVQSRCDASPLGALAPAPAAAASEVCYYVAQSAGNMVTAADRYGFHLASGVLFSVIAGAAPVQLTDPSAVVISDFVVSPITQTVSMAGYCKSTCTVNCPRVIVREFEVLIKGNIPGDTSIQRSLRSNLRVRNDYYDGFCPSS